MGSTPSSHVEFPSGDKSNGQTNFNQQEGFLSWIFHRVFFGLSYSLDSDSGLTQNSIASKYRYKTFNSCGFLLRELNQAEQNILTQLVIQLGKLKHKEIYFETKNQERMILSFHQNGWECRNWSEDDEYSQIQPLGYVNITGQQLEDIIKNKVNCNYSRLSNNCHYWAENLYKYARNHKRGY